MSNITVTTNQSVIDVTNTSGITVTTPEGQTIAVTVPSSSVNVTNTTDDITILTAGTLNINTQGVVTSVNGDTGPAVVLTTTNIAEGTNLYYTTARQNTDFDTRLATKTTTNLAEGTNLYYTTARQNTDFDARLATKTTDNLTQGATNKYFSQALARQSLSAGTGISYDNSTGVITNTSINTDTTYTIDATTATGGANLNLVGSDATTDSIKIASGTNITVSRTDANTITIDGSDLNTTYAISSAATSGGANLTLTGSDASTDSVAYLGSGATTVTSTNANTITIASTDTNTTYTQNASATSGGANLNLVGSDSTTDSVSYLGSGATTITRTDDSTITVSSTDTNTTYTQNISSTSGGANLNLVGSDSTTDTVKFADGTGVTVSYTDANTATIAIGQSVATSANPTFAGVTGGNVTVGVDTDQTISTSSGNLILQTAAGVNAGSITLASGVNGNLTLAPNGTGDIVVTLGNGGNLTNSRNYVFGAIRNSTTEGIGDIWALNSTGPTNPFRGISIDNSADTTKGPGTVLRSYGTANGVRGRLIFERARGTAAIPAALQTGDFLGSIDAVGYTSTGWLNDNVSSVVSSFFGFFAAENWISNTNLGTSFLLSQAPTATTITGNANLISTLTVNPQTSASRSDAFTWANGKTGTTQTMALDVSGNLTVTGDVRVNGGDIQNPGGTSAITLTSANATTTIKGDAITLEDNAGTDYAVLNSTSATFAQPVGLPVKTAAAWNAITGAVGRMVCVSDSASGPHPNGMMAFWDTSNARWSYIHDNTAV